MKKKNRPPNPSQSPYVVVGSFENDLVLFHQLSKQYYVLNTVAARIWQLCDGTRPVAEITEWVQNEFDVPPEQVAADVSQTVEGFAELGLVET
jgi:PqqD family protein of HPr-rel-A system